MALSHRTRDTLREPSNADVVDPSGEAALLPLPAITPDDRGPAPIVTWYRMLFTVSVLSFGTWKTVASFKNGAVVPTALDWVTGVGLTILFFWLGECAAVPSLHWLFRRSAVTDIAVHGTATITISGRLIRGGIERVVTVCVFQPTRRGELDIILGELECPDHSVSVYAPKSPRLPPELLVLIVEFAIQEHLENALASSLLSETTEVSASYSEHDTLRTLIAVSFTIRDIALRAIGGTLAISFIPDGIGSLSVPPWKRIEEIRSLGSSFATDIWIPKVPTIGWGPQTVRAYASLHTARNLVISAKKRYAEVVGLEDYFPCCARPFEPHESEAEMYTLAESCPTLCFCWLALKEASRLVKEAQWVATTSLIDGIPEVPTLKSISLRAHKTAWKVPSQERILDHYIAHMKKSEREGDPEDVQRIILDALKFIGKRRKNLKH